MHVRLTSKVRYRKKKKPKKNHFAHMVHVILLYCTTIYLFCSQATENYLHPV